MPMRFRAMPPWDTRIKCQTTRMERATTPALVVHHTARTRTITQDLMLGDLVAAAKLATVSKAVAL